MGMDPGESFDAFMQRFMVHIMGGSSGPTTNNPDKYPRKVKVTDDEVLMLRAKQEHVNDQVERMIGQLTTLKHEAEMLKGRMFLRLEEIYPDVRVKGGGGTGHRSWKGDFWYVSWDKKADEEDNDKTED